MSQAMRLLTLFVAFALGASVNPRAHARAEPEARPSLERRLYVAVPGIRNYLQYGGHGILVFDIEHDHKFLRRISAAGLDDEGKPLNVKGICASVATGRLYVSTTRQLQCYDLRTEERLWERTYEAGCDRMSITPDGTTLYLPSFEGPLWYVVDGSTGAVRSQIRPDSGAHNTIVGLDGKAAYLAGLRSPFLTVVSTHDPAATRTVGPFSAAIRPFTIDGLQTRAYVCVNERLGFEVGDLESGKVLARVDVPGYEKGPVKRHGCPSHGIGMTPDERELWVCDAHNQALHVFDTTELPPNYKYRATIKLKDEPGWITFSLDGRLAYPSTGEVIGVDSRHILTQLRDETGAAVQSEKLLEIDFEDGHPTRAGDQFGLGRVVVTASPKAAAP
jgi:hypothetical protein